MPTARANFNRVYRKSFTTRRRACPFARGLQYRRLKDASRILKLTELCLAELRHQRALSLAPFGPGDQMRVCATTKGYEASPRRYLVRDVEWRKGDHCVYVVHELTKRESLHKGRWRTWLCPSSWIAIESCTEPLDPETVHYAEGGGSVRKRVVRRYWRRVPWQSLTRS